MKSADAFMPRVMPFVQGCTIPMAHQALVDAAIEFCEESQKIRADADSITTQAGVSSYEIDCPVLDSRVDMVTKVTIDGNEIKPGDEVIGVQGKPQTYSVTVLDGEVLVQLNPTPDAAYTVGVEVSTAPKRSATSFHDDLYERWIDTVIKGTIGRIKLIPDQVFSDPMTGQAMKTLALSEAKKARSRVLGQRDLRVKNHPFA